MNKLSLLLLLFIFSFHNTAIAQAADWEFKREVNNISVYTKDHPDTNIKSLKIVMEADVSINAVVQLLLDISAYRQWVYKCSHSEHLEAGTGLSTYDYYQIDFPWPFSDRDMYVHSIITKDHNTGVITSESKGVPGYGPERKGFVRVLEHHNKWIITPIGPKRTHLVYTLAADPAGAIPDWLINLAADQGPIKSMKSFLKLVKTIPYQSGVPIGGL